MIYAFTLGLYQRGGRGLVQADPGLATATSKIFGQAHKITVETLV